MDDARPTSTGPTRRHVLHLAALGVPAVAAGAPEHLTTRFTHRGHRVQVTRHGRAVALEVDGRALPAAVRVRNDGVLTCPDLLPFSDAEWGTDVRELARRLIDGNGVDHVLF